MDYSPFPAKRGRGRGEGQERRGRRNDRSAEKGE
jgi:small subunit ribosomal protein S3